MFNPRMLTLDLLYAVLQGLPPTFLTFLDPAWVFFCEHIAKAIRFQIPPLEALRYALQEASPWERKALKEALSLVGPASQVKGITYRQREALIALRQSGLSSLRDLCLILQQDPGNTHRRMAALVRKGHALRILLPQGVHYFAVAEKLGKDVRLGVHQMLASLLEELESQPVPLQLQPEPTKPTMPTIPTIQTIPTTADHFSSG
jgi:hypothetical protein